MQGEHGLFGCIASARRLVCGFRVGLCAGVAGILLAGYPGFAAGLTRPAGDLAPLNSPDGELNAADFLILQKYILGTLTPTPEQQLLADVAPLGNPDGDLNAGDLVVLLRAIHGAVTLPPIYLGPDAPVLNAASGTTTTNPYALTGTAEPGRDVRLYLNGEVIETANTGTNGNFNFNLILRDGENQLYAVVVDAGQEGPASDLISLDYVNDIPREQGGMLTADTVWTPGVVPTPYVITSTLTVAPGATLTLMPGTVLRFAAGTAFQVDGTLIVSGSSTAPVVFTADAENPLRGSWNGIQIRAGSQNNRIGNAVVDYAVNGISVDATNLFVHDCTIRFFASNWYNYGIAYTDGATGSIQNCMIDNQGVIGNNYSQGVYIDSGAQPDVIGNLILNNGAGIQVQHSSPWISGNSIHSNKFGVLLQEGASALINNQNIITDNTSSGLQFEGGAENFPQCIVSGNSIFNNPWNVYSVSYDYVGDQDISVENNWWGSTSPSVISSGIWDFKNLPEMAPVVKIAPFLDGPGGQQVPDTFLSGRATGSVDLVGGDTYTVLGAYVLGPDVPFTVQSGTRIELASDALIYAAGGLSVQGAEDSPAVFASADDIGSLPPGWGLFVTGGNEISISDAVFENLFIATSVYQTAVSITNSHYSNNVREGIYLYDQATGLISDNEFTGYRGGESAYGYTYGISSGADNITIERNAISGVDIGLALNSGAPVIRENTISNTMFGVQLYAPCCGNNLYPVITNGNTITGNDYGIYSQSLYAGTIAVNGNNIHDNGWNYYKFSSTVAEDATGNWWGSPVEAEVASGVYAQTAGTVTFVPFLTGPIPIAPRLDANVPLTASSSYTVTGTAQPGAQIRIHVNDTPQTTLSVAPDGTFSGQVSLSEGLNTVYAEAFNETTVSSPSATITVTLDSIPPVITLTAPLEGARMNTYPVFTGTISEPVSLLINGEAVNVGTDNSFTSGQVMLNEGTNAVELRATDQAGHETALTIGLTLDTTPPTNPNIGLVTFGPLSGGTVPVVGAPGAGEPSSEVHVANARTGEVTMVTVNADGAFDLAIAAQSGDTLTLVVTDDLGNQTAWYQEVLPGTPPALSIGATYPDDGAVVNATQVTVSGEYQGPEGTGIVVAGQPAMVYGGRFIVSNVALMPGANSLDLTATAPDGTVVSRSLALTSTGSIPFSVNVTPEAGGLPYAGKLTLSNETGQPMQLVEMDLEDDGHYESSYPNLNYETVWWNIWYTEPGLYRGRIRIVDYTGSTYELTFGVLVQDAIGLQAGLRAMYQNTMNSLRAGNIQGALNRFAGTSRQRYETVFNSLSANLTDAVDSLGSIKSVTVGQDWAELLLVREQSGVPVAYRINAIRCEDGVWRIEGM